MQSENLIKHSIIDFFQKGAKKEFIDEYSFDEIYKKANEIAQGLEFKGLKQKQRVLLQYWNELDFVVNYFGVLLAGGVPVSISPLLTPTEKEYIQKHSQQEINKNNLPEDLATIIYTSGTTSDPKGVMLRYKNINAQIKFSSKVLKLTPDDSFLGVLSFGHVFGQMNILWSALANSSKITTVKRFNAQEALKKLYENECSILIAVPTMYSAMTAYLERNKNEFSQGFKRLRVCHSGATAMSEVLFKKTERLFNAPVQEGYGLTETCSMAFSNPLHVHENRKPCSVGVPIGDLKFKITDENIKELPVGEIGEILIKGETITDGYFCNKDATEKAIIDGWLLTGDLGYKDEDNYLHIVDRKKDLIIRGGYKVYPREIEEILLKHSSVSQVAVVGDKERDSRLYCFVILKSDCQEKNISESQLESELKDFCSESLAKYKIPNKFLFVKEFPLTFSGKIQKRKLLD